MRSEDVTGDAPVRGGSSIGTDLDVAGVLVVKHLDAAKTRLAASLPDAPTGGYRDLVLAMLLDTVAAVREAGLDPVVVVSPDPAVLHEVTVAGARGLPESPRPDPSLNHAYAEGARWVRRHRPDRRWVAMIQADLPAARSGSLREVVAAAAGLPESVVTDASGDGTVLLLRPTEQDRVPRFGFDSARAHRADGAVELDAGRTRWPDLRTDVDTAADLERARSLGVGRHTRAVLTPGPPPRMGAGCVGIAGAPASRSADAS